MYLLYYVALFYLFIFISYVLSIVYHPYCIYIYTPYKHQKHLNIHLSTIIQEFLKIAVLRRIQILRLDLPIKFTRISYLPFLALFVYIYPLRIFQYFCSYLICMNTKMSTHKTHIHNNQNSPVSDHI